MVNTESDDPTLFWKEAIEEQKSSRLSIVDYCEVAGTTVGRFHYWKSKLRRKERSDAEGETAPQFFECAVASSKAERETDSLIIEIGPFRLRFDHRTDQSLFRRAATILQAVYTGRES